VAGTVSLGTGDVTIDANLIRGNFAEGGQGGGIRLQQVNGADVTNFGLLTPIFGHRVTITNNMIENNVAGWAGGGISLSDTLLATIVNNTISSNDSAGIAGVVLAGGVPVPATTPGLAGRGYPSPSGIVSEPTSPQLLAQVPNLLKGSFAISQPVLLENNILWRNRSFFYSGDGRLCAGNSRAAAAGGSCTTLPDQATTGQCPAGASYWDLGVLGDASVTPGTRHLNPTFSVITSTTGYTGTGNRTADPRLATPYCNGARMVPELGGVLNPPSIMNLQVAATVDEGNNYVNLRYGPLYSVNPVSGTAFGNYHIAAGSSAFNTGFPIGAPNHDIDGQSRPFLGGFDIGADEIH
jgi:hypothetical protein